MRVYGRQPLFGLALLLLGFFLCGASAQGEDSGSEEPVDKADLVPTFRTGIEKVLQGLGGLISSSSTKSEESSRGGIGGFLDSILPKPIKRIENATARGFGDVLNLFEDHFHAIFPGTLWCGGGNIASSEEEVGLFDNTDACCRAHDECPSNINAGGTKGRLLNNGAFTRSACFCDHQFYQCLKNVSSVISANIGATYFTILRPQCFALDYPIESCAEHGSNRIVNKKCAKYNKDETKDKQLEWFDNPDF